MTVHVDDRLVFRLAERMWERDREMLEPDPSKRKRMRFVSVGGPEWQSYSSKARAALEGLVSLGAAVLLPDTGGAPAFAAIDLPMPVEESCGGACWESPLVRVLLNRQDGSMAVLPSGSTRTGDGSVMDSVLAVLAGTVALLTLDIERRPW